MLRVLFAMSALVLATVSCEGQERIDSVSQAWVNACPGDSFCFSRPADLREVPVQVIDSLAGVFESSNLTLRFDMGRYPTSLNHLEHPVITDMTIDGRPAQTLAAGSEIALRVPDVGNQVQFTMQLVFKGPVASETARRIFQSITFKPSGIQR